MSHEVILAALAGVAEACRVTRHVQSALASIATLTKDDRSPVTVADFAAQAIVARHLFAMEGGALNLVGEETGAALRENPTLAEAVVSACQVVWPEANLDSVIGAVDLGNHDASADRYWTLDPVDGTKGFLRNGQYAISLALIESGQVVCGALGCPNLSPDPAAPVDQLPATGSLFFATKGEGARMLTAGSDPAEACPVRVTRGDATGVRMCESVEAGHSKHDDTARILAALGETPSAVRLDSQCKYAVVARGQADVYLRMPTRKDYVERIWDHAAGMLVATEAGAIVTDVRGNALDFGHGAGLEVNRGIVCAHPDFHARLVAAIDTLGLKPD